MKKPLLGQHDYLDAFIKTAQYLAGLTTQQDMWGETGKALVNFFGADLCVFGKRKADGEIAGHHWTFSDQTSNQKNLGPETKEAIAEVLESSFLTSQIIFTPDPLSAAFLPITQKSQVTDVMLVGHRMSGPIPKELLNVYLAIARLIGTTAEGLASEIELRKHRDHLDELVKDRTAKLTKTNEQLQQDITERKRAEEEKNKLETQLQQSQKMEAVGTLAGGIAHDFNNILAVILGNTELASDDVPDSNPASKSLKAIHQASIRAKDMVRQLLAFSRKSDEESKPLDIAPVIKESMKMLRHAIPTSVEFKQHISDAFCNVMGDAAQINQIVMNLVTNAAHAMSEEGGLLEVTLEHIILQKEKACFDWVLSPGSYVRLRMKDTGEGIEPKIMDRIFDPYFTTKDVGKGTGMGLSVIHGIVKRHGGGILVESELGKGTVFEIYFPALGETAEVEKEPLGEIKGGSERILFVDDEESMVDLNRQRLERLGYNVKSTIKPVEALEWFKADPDQFDVIITDMTMPRMTGDRLAAEVLKIRPHMPVIICTGYSERMSAKKAEVLGVSKYIEKPIGARNLASAIREVLDEK